MNLEGVSYKPFLFLLLVEVNVGLLLEKLEQNLMSFLHLGLVALFSNCAENRIHQLDVLVVNQERAHRPTKIGPKLCYGSWKSVRRLKNRIFFLKNKILESLKLGCSIFSERLTGGSEIISNDNKKAS